MTTALAFKLEDLRALPQELSQACICPSDTGRLDGTSGPMASIPLSIFMRRQGFSIILTLYLWRMVSQRSAAGNGHLYKVLIEYQGREASFTGFLDTGNRLTEGHLYGESSQRHIGCPAVTELFGIGKCGYIRPLPVGRKGQRGILPTGSGQTGWRLKRRTEKIIEKQIYRNIGRETVTE